MKATSTGGAETGGIDPETADAAAAAFACNIQSKSAYKVTTNI
jgi:hypothetical protein